MQLSSKESLIKTIESSLKKEESTTFTATINNEATKNELINALYPKTRRSKDES